mgnify:CR=1 FL=1
MYLMHCVHVVTYGSSAILLPDLPRHVRINVCPYVPCYHGIAAQKIDVGLLLTNSGRQE